MKFIFSLLGLFFLSSSSTPWLRDFEQAKNLAEKDHKLILVNFSGSDWCGPCIRMHKEIFESQAFENYAGDHLVLVNADFPRLKKHQLPKDQAAKNEALADKYNKQGTFPLTVLIDEKGNVLKKWEGYPDENPQQFVADINGLANGR